MGRSRNDVVLVALSINMKLVGKYIDKSGTVSFHLVSNCVAHQDRVMSLFVLKMTKICGICTILYKKMI